MGCVANAGFVDRYANRGAWTTLMSAQNFQSTTEVNGSTDMDVFGTDVEIEIKISKTGSPTRIQLILSWSNDSGTTFGRTDHGWEPYIIFVAAEVTGTFVRSFTVPARGARLRVSGLAGGTASGSHYFTFDHVKARWVNP